MNLNELTKLEAAMTPGQFYPAANELFDDMDVITVAACGQVAAFHAHPGYSREQAKADARGIVALRNAAPALIAAARERDELAALLRAVCNCMDGVYCEDVGGRNWFDARNAAFARLGVPE